MKDLLAYYDLVAADAAAIQLAVLEEVTYANVMKTGAEQTVASGLHATRWLASKVGLQTRQEKQKVPSTAERVLARAQHLQRQSKAATERALFSLLARRLSVEEDNLAMLSSRLIREAAANYDLSEDLLLSQQASAVAKLYMTECQEGLREKLRSQSAEEAKATDKILNDTLAQLSANEKLEIQKALKLDSLSASSVRDVVLKSGIPFAGIAAVQAGGFGGYLALTTLMHAVFTSLLGITLPFAAYTTATSALSLLTGPLGIMFSLSLGIFGYIWGQRKIQRSQYALIVFTCVGHATEALIPQTFSLPSAQAYKLLGDGNSTTARVEVPQLEKDYFLALQQETKDRETTEYEASSSTSLTEKSLQSLRSTERSLKSAQELVASLNIKETAGEGVRNSLEKMVTNQLRKVARLEAELKAAKDAYDRALIREDEQRNKALGAAKKQEARVERKSKDLEALWKIRYTRINFKPSPLKWAAKQEFEDRLEIERALAELHDAKDPVSLSLSRMHVSHEHHLGFTSEMARLAGSSTP